MVLYIFNHYSLTVRQVIGETLFLGIEGAFKGPGQKTVIPSRVVGKFSIRLVPDQDPNEINALVEDYLQRLHKERGTSTVCKIQSPHSAKPWVSDFNHPHYVAGRRAIKTGAYCSYSLMIIIIFL